MNGRWGRAELTFDHGPPGEKSARESDASTIKRRNYSEYKALCRRTSAARSYCGGNRTSALQGLDEVQHFFGVSGHLDAAPFLRNLAVAIDDERASLDAAHFLAVHVFHLDDAEFAAQLFIRIRDEFEGKPHLRLESLVRLERIARASDDDGAKLAELGIEIAKLRAFVRAARRVVLRIDVEHHRMSFLRRQLERSARRIGGEVDHLLSQHRDSPEIKSYAASATSARNSSPCINSVPLRPASVPMVASQRGSASGSTASYSARIGPNCQPCAFQPVSSRSSTGDNRIPSSSACSV